MTDGVQVRAWARLMMIPVLASAALVLAGCPDEDKDDGKGGGGTIIVPEQFPPIPTNRPTLTGMPITIDLSGGDAQSPQGNGGSAGDVFIEAPAGTVMEDDDRAEPAAGANFLTAAVLADNVVTFTELVGIDPANVSMVSSGVYIDIDGADFHLPAGATLDLTDATAENLAIRGLGPDDRVIIAGTVLCAATSFDGINLLLISHATSGTAISVSGTLDTRGTTSGPNAGDVLMLAEWGDVMVRGTVIARGVPGISGGGQGGDLSILASQGDVVLAAGMWQTNGGSAAVGGFSDQGGRIEVLSAFDMTFAWGIRANGGGGSSAQWGGDIRVQCWQVLTLNMPFDLNGGSSTSATGGGGGQCEMEGWVIIGVAAGSADGGDGIDGGGQGGSVYMRGASITGVALDATANAGNAQTGGGGSGGSVEINTDGQLCVNVLLDGEARGGDGTTGGDGGYVAITGDATQTNSNLVSNVSGGTGTTGSGGFGGSTGVGIYNELGAELQQVSLTVIANGGNGFTGGSGGFIFVDPGAGTNNNVTAMVTATGGAAVMGGPPAGDGGRGGFLSASNSEGGGSWSMVLTLSGSMIGGMSDGGSGGQGGGVEFVADGNGGWYEVNTQGTFSMRGGNALATGQGGVGGTMYVSTDVGKVFESDNFSFDMRGGDSAQGSGGPGAGTGRLGNPGLRMFCSGSIDLRGGTIDMSGGQGSTTSGTGTGGTGGEAQFYTMFGDISFAGTLLINGGDGPGGGGGAVSGEAVEFNADSDADGIAGMIRMSGVVRCNGGNGTGTDASGGNSGYIWFLNMDQPMVSGGDIIISGIVESNGGSGTGLGSGGNSSGIEVSSAGSLIEVSGTLRQLAGAGDFGGSVSGPYVASVSTTTIVIGGTIESAGGNGTTLGGDAGTIQIGSPSWGAPAATIDVLAGAVVRNTAATGGVRGNGAIGFIDIDAQGTSGANVTVDGSATIEVLDSGGSPVPANVTID
jgi:hypothetical protein